MLENMAVQDIQNGHGMCFIDPHGSTAEKLLEYVPEHRIKDVVYFAPFDLDNPISFNVMEDVGKDQRHLVVNGLMSAFKKIWVDAWSARMEYILSNTLLALLEYPGSTLLGVNRMLADKEFRKKVVGGKAVRGDVVNQEAFEIWKGGKKIGDGKILNLQSGKEDVKTVDEGQEAGMLVSSDVEIASGMELRFLNA
jgi:hypothetical protein